MGELEVSGKGASEFVQQMITNDVARLYVGKSLYTCMCYESGTTVDDLLVFKLAKDRYMLVVNAVNTQKDFDWLCTHRSGRVKIRDISDRTAKIDLQGPLAEPILQKLTSADLGSLRRFHFLRAKVSGTDTLISRTGYTAEDGFELFMAPRSVERVWWKVLEVGSPKGLKPVGLGARDTLRIEAGYSLYGHELDETITPVEAGLGWLVREYKERFVGKEVLVRQKTQGTDRTLIVFEMVGRAIPRQHCPVEVEGVQIGRVTSGVWSPTFRRGIGMALVTTEHAKIGKTVEIVIRGKRCRAVIKKRPLYPYRGISR
jgi:aminomethyltransferase